MKTCSIDGCGKKHKGHGYCDMHYQRWKKYGDPLFTPYITGCSVDDCDRKHYGKGMCHLHWERVRLHGSTDLPEREKGCIAVDCERERYGHGYCQKHWQRWRKYGDPNGRAQREAPVERFRRNVRPDGDCLIWTGYLNPSGYGQMSVDGRLVSVHRFSYEQESGAIPAGMFIDHACGNRACCLPAHLRLATPEENTWNLPASGRSNATGFRGVYLDKRRGTYYAQVTKRGEVVTLGPYLSVVDADSAARAKRVELFGEFAGRA